MRREPLEEQVTAPPIDRSHAAEMPVELAAHQEIGERELVECRRSPVGEVFGGGDVVHQVRRHDHPAETQAGRERLAG